MRRSGASLLLDTRRAEWDVGKEPGGRDGRQRRRGVLRWGTKTRGPAGVPGRLRAKLSRSSSVLHDSKRRHVCPPHPRPLKGRRGRAAAARARPGRQTGASRVLCPTRPGPGESALLPVPGLPRPTFGRGGGARRACAWPTWKQILALPAAPSGGSSGTRLRKAARCVSVLTCQKGGPWQGRRGRRARGRAMEAWQGWWCKRVARVQKGGQ